MDPRVKTSPAGLQQQFELEMKITEAIHRDYDALQQLRKVRSQLKDLRQRAGLGPTADAINALEKTLTELEGSSSGGGFGVQYLSTTDGRSLARLNSALTSLLGTVDSADAAPTTQAIGMFGDVQQALEQQLSRWQEIKKQEISTLNATIRQAGLSPINVEVEAGTEKK